jgi:ABC-type glycerol-3-phosphate transport system substrate-binding protein
MNKLWKASALLAGTMFAAMPVTTMADEIDFMVIDYDAPGMGEWWHLLVDTYNSNSGHTVVPRNTPASEYYSQLTIQAVSGAGADVVIVNPNNLGEMLAGKLVMPLTDKIKAAGLEDMIVEGGFDALSKDGEIYALPITGRTLELIYNACYFEEVGLSGPPATPEEFLDHARKLVVHDDGGRVTRYGANMVNANEDPTYEMLLMWSIANGGSYADEDGNFTVNSQPVVDALEFMKTLYSEGLVPQGMTETDQRALFATGGSAMTIDGQWQFPFIRKNNPDGFDCYKSAQHPWDGPGTGGINMALAVSADSDSADAAFEFLKTAASSELQSQFANYSPYIPYGKNALTEEQIAQQPYLKPYIASSGGAHPVAIPGHADKFNLIWPILVDAVLRTLRNDVPAQESLDQAQGELEACCAN